MLGISDGLFSYSDNTRFISQYFNNFDMKPCDGKGEVIVNIFDNPKTLLDKLKFFIRMKKFKKALYERKIVGIKYSIFHFKGVV